MQDDNEQEKNLENENTAETKEQTTDSKSDELETNKDNGKKADDSKPKKNEVDSSNCRFTKGQMLTFVRVRFPGNAKSFPFLINKNNKKFAYGQKVVAMSDRGVTVGYINSFPYEAPFHDSLLPIRSINKIATEEDIKIQQQQLEREKHAENLCLSLIEKYKLDMNLTHVEIIQYGKKAVFYFTAPERVDFRDLVKGLVTDLKMRIELRQISVRDRTAALGAISACGRQNCCSSFLKNYGAVNIKMAKNQNLALIPAKINGVCGQTKCCIRFEDDVYTQKRGFLPKENSYIKTKNGDKGKVIKLNVLFEEFEMITDTGKKRRYSSSEFSRNFKLPEGWSFPSSFEFIVDETKDLIGEKKILKPSSVPDSDMFNSTRQEVKVFTRDKNTSKDSDQKTENLPNKKKSNRPKRSNYRNKNRSRSKTNTTSTSSKKPS